MNRTSQPHMRSKKHLPLALDDEENDLSAENIRLKKQLK